MRASSTSRVAAAVLSLVLVSALPVLADETPSADAARKSIERGLAFLQQDAVKWRQEHECATCHHGTLTVWALSEAKRQSYAIDAQSFTDTVQWTKERLKNIDKPR